MSVFRFGAIFDIWSFSTSLTTICTECVYNMFAHTYVYGNLSQWATFDYCLYYIKIGLIHFTFSSFSHFSSSSSSQSQCMCARTSTMHALTQIYLLVCLCLFVRSIARSLAVSIIMYYLWCMLEDNTLNSIRIAQNDDISSLSHSLVLFIFTHFLLETIYQTHSSCVILEHC